jgi:hypothetical protein
VTPDLCDDTHDCSVATGDRWLAAWVPRILASDTYRSARTAVLVVWDEYTPMPFIAAGPAVAPGTTVSVPLDHFALLRTTEEMLGLGLLARANGAPSMRMLFGL